MLNPVRPVVLEADPGPSGPVNDRIPEFRSSGGFSGGKEKVKKKFHSIFFTFFLPPENPSEDRNSGIRSFTGPD